MTESLLNQFMSHVRENYPQLEAYVREGYSTIFESDDGAQTDAIFEEDSQDTTGEDGDTVTMSLDSLADNADQIQAVLQKKKTANADEKAADEQLVALGNSDTSSAEV